MWATRCAARPVRIRSSPPRCCGCSRAAASTAHRGSWAPTPRLAVVADGYGLARRQRAGPVDAMLERPERHARWWAGRPEPRAPEVETWSWREHAHTLAHSTLFTAALGAGGDGRP
ncbi:hypothetical protein [Jiangella ureilytica]|uniref:hypothetical protein n=1 Tax=Jiangella ureilytica TaxID=2530374 RepID=UPI00193C86E1|nr:hypothetical protein [Jiangella ureilytica]